MTSNQLLCNIRDFISASVKDDLSESERQALSFNNGLDIIEAIDNHLDNTYIVEEYDPFDDPEARALLGRAGINVHGHKR
jgi:hypothetical protein